MKTNITIPTLDKIPKKMKIHGDLRVDNYYWLNEKENPKVIKYLDDENSFFDEKMSSTTKLQNELFLEMKSRIKEDDASVPVKKNGYFYYSRFEEGGQYAIHCRKKDTLESKEEIIFDLNKMAEGHSYFSMNTFKVSPNNRFVAFGIDTVSRRKYTIQIKDLKTGEIFPEKIENTSNGVAWAADNKTFFYTHKNPDDLRESKIFKHIIDTDTAKDKMVYSEDDDTFVCYASKSKSGDYIFIGSYSTLTTEYRILSADKPDNDFTLFQKRERSLEYHIDHFEDSFIIKTNKDNASNFKLMRCLTTATKKDQWKDLIAHRENSFISDFHLFKDFYIIEERTNGLNNIRIIKWDNSSDYNIKFNEETYDVYLSSNPEFNSNVIRYNYNSLTTPTSVIDYNVLEKTKEIRKETEIVGSFDKKNYISKRIWATGRDGKKIAISMVYHKDTKISKDTPFLLYAYGSYGYTMPDYFSSVRLSILDRGFIYATAHIRGSQYLGRSWYEDGKLFNKMNTFNDFIDCAKHLIANNYTSQEHLFAQGGSAGGLLMGAVINMNGELFKGVHSAVPFVDVMTTMLDDTLPLTTGEYDEWGNPNEKEAYEYMLSYSPYDNVKNKEYPNLLVTTGLHDSQVQYFEPAKWVAKLRELKTDNNHLLLYTDMEVGHGGASGRFNGLKDIARIYSFFLGLEKNII